MIDNYFNNRCTIRNFSSENISNELLENLLEKASHAPTTGNMQLYSVIITEDKEKRKALNAMHFNQPASVNANKILTFCADFNRPEKWCYLRNAKPGYRNFQSFITALIDATIFTQQFNTIAELNGIGCCYLGTTPYNAPQIAELLELPDLVIPVASLAIGYPENDNAIKSERLPISGIIHMESYKDYNDDKINQIYNEKENREVNKKFVVENNKETLAQVFTDIHYNENNNTIFSKLYYDFIEARGYSFPKQKN